MVIPLSKAIGAGFPYWISYGVWAAIGLFMSVRKSKSENRKSQNLFSVMFIVLVGSLIVSAIFPKASFFEFAFPGFWIGIAVALALILVKRSRGKRHKHHHSVTT